MSARVATTDPELIVRAWVAGPSGRDVGDCLILRTARKGHRCVARLCSHGHAAIQPGERYVEYGGEVAAYQTGSAYHLHCAIAEWSPGGFLADVLVPAEWLPRDRWGRVVTEQPQPRPGESSAAFSQRILGGRDI